MLQTYKSVAIEEAVQQTLLLICYKQGRYMGQAADPDPDRREADLGSMQLMSPTLKLVRHYPKGTK